jgi:hypothetical protein
MKGHQTYLGWTLGILLLWVIIIPTMAEQALPATPLPLFEGGSLNLQNFTGKVVVIRFLASW